MTPHFRARELACQCGCGKLPAVGFMEKVERVRVRCDFPFAVTSAARCGAHNAKVSSTGETGPHTTGHAIDIAVMGNRALDLVRIALEEGFTGIGVQQKGKGRFIHLDDLPNADGQPRPWIWSY